MQFSDTSTNQGIIQRCEYFCFGEGNYGAISDKTERLQTFTGFINSALNKVEAKILNADTRWQYDDSNYSTHPIGTADLVAGQQDYAMSVSHMKVLRVEVQDSAGNWVEIHPIDHEDINGEGLEEFHDNDGMPKFYDKLGNSIFLYPAPASGDVMVGEDSESLKVYHQREPDYFETSDTTKTPGFPAIFHEVLAHWASYEYLRTNQNYDKATTQQNDAMRMEQEMQTFFSKRDKDERNRITAKRGNFK